MKKIAVFMNTDRLGGAERSLIHQFKSLSTKNEYTFFIPRVSQSLELENFIMENGFQKVVFFDFPMSFYEQSRSRVEVQKDMITDVFSLFVHPVSFYNLNDFDTVYLNGNKVAFLFLSKTILKPFKGEVIWHLRDYFVFSKLMTMMFFVLKGFARCKVKFVCNSFSVLRSLERSFWGDCEKKVMYNMVGEALPTRKLDGIKTIGLVSMLAPWKGIHEVILFASLYENELRKIGVEKIKIFGEAIYKTNGTHSHYKRDLKKLIDKLGVKIISLEGGKPPHEIFSEIDCLIHYSIKPEPFGRVITEAYEAGVPVISTGIGGAGELTFGGNALTVTPYDLQGLFDKIFDLSQNDILRNSLIQKAKNFVNQLHEQTNKEILGEYEVKVAS